MSQVEDVVLSGCLTPLVETIKRNIYPEFFEDDVKAELYRRLIQFWLEKGIPMSKEALKASLESLNAEQRIKFEETVEKLSDSIDLALVHQRMEALIQLYKDRETRAVADLAKELRTGKDLEIRGKMLARLLEIKNKTSISIITEDFTGEEAKDKMFQFIEDQKNQQVGVLSGIKELDRELNGGRAGELWVYYAASGHGKSTMLRNHCYNAVIEQGKNVALFSAELGLDLMRLNVMAIHAFKKFGLDSFNTKHLRAGQLTPEVEKVFKEAVDDFTNNPKYGKLIFEKVSAGQTIQDIHARCEEIHKFTPLSAVFVDYFDRLAMMTKGTENYLTKGETFIYAQRDFALNFNQGEGIFVCTAHQINRVGKEKAVKRSGIYLLEDAANTPDAYRSPDVVISMFKLSALEGDKKEKLPRSFTNESRMAVLKNRHGEGYPDLPYFDVESHFQAGSLRSFEDGMSNRPSQMSLEGGEELDFGDKEDK